MAIAVSVQLHSTPAMNEWEPSAVTPRRRASHGHGTTFSGSSRSPTTEVTFVIETMLRNISIIEA